MIKISIEIIVNNKTVIFDKEFYINVIHDKNYLKFDCNKILNYKDKKVAHLVLEYNHIYLTSDERYRCSSLHDFRVVNINVYKKDIMPSQKLFDSEYISKLCMYKESSKLLSWFLKIFIDQTNKQVIFIWKHKNRDVEVHGTFDIDILSMNRIDIERFTPKFRPNVSKYYIEHKQKPIHRILLTANCNEDVDHINLITTDNRLCNIRIVDNRENILNRGVFKGSNSGVKGVITEFNSDKTVKRFRAEIVIKGKTLKKSFSVNKYGYDDALNLAINQREKWNEEFGYRSSTRENR